ncbi:hypothetical protein [Actinokineospora spheciospongiae]|uniref:hypothetical protein n=1 Tax=Actinokineospora spheciospongiae TaxID=909613 RepID=UPI000D71C194|nr:hypothetical protein [Actinokineospora spheciospongiae]PWW67001.1 hypothetical protein DFQ13_101519 [Actinokineospora spheciospongiae]
MGSRTERTPGAPHRGGAGGAPGFDAVGRGVDLGWLGPVGDLGEPDRAHRGRFAMIPTTALGRALGLSGRAVRVEVDDRRVLVRLGPWRLSRPCELLAEVGGRPRGPAAVAAALFAAVCGRDHVVCVRFRHGVRGGRGPRTIVVGVDDPRGLTRMLRQHIEAREVGTAAGTGTRS